MRSDAAVVDVCQAVAACSWLAAGSADRRDQIALRDAKVRP
jgi:hypothetical protein